jgi:hypothetical protein
MTIASGSFILGFIAGLTVGEVTLFFFLAVVRADRAPLKPPSPEPINYFKPASSSLSCDGALEIGECSTR